jgi:hypothetical protein
MKSVTQWLDDLESECREASPKRGHALLVSGRVRIECEFLPDVDQLSWWVNSRAVSRDTAARALAHARTYPDRPFVQYR